MARPASCKSSVGESYLRRGRKRTNRQRTHIAQRRRNFVRQSEPKKIQILVRSQILQGQHGKGSCAPRTPPQARFVAGFARRQTPARRPQPHQRPARSFRKNASARQPPLCCSAPLRYAGRNLPAPRTPTPAPLPESTSNWLRPESVSRFKRCKSLRISEACW